MHTQAQGKANQIAGQAQKALGAAADDIRDVGRQVTTGVQEQPLGALLAAVGFALGMIVRR